MGAIQTLALMWAGAMIRNKSDRDATIKFFNHIGKGAENAIAGLMGKGGAKPYVEKVAPETEPIQE